MPSFLSGVRGGLKGHAASERRRTFCQEALSDVLSESDIEAEVRRSIVNRAITLVINNSCNLACRHCYLQIDKLAGPELTTEEYTRLVNSALDQQPELICLSGKEVFLGTHGVEVLSLLTTARRARKSRTRIGLITNGTLIHRHRAAILASDPDYLDISVDGIETDHDYNRGFGAFAAMRPNLEWAARNLGDRLFVNMTLQKRNSPNLAEAILNLHRFGIQTVGCGFYHPLPYTDRDLALNEADCDAIFANLRALESATIDGPLTVLIEVDTISLPALEAFMRSEWFSAQAIDVDERGDFFNETILKNGIRLQVRFAPFPLLIYKSVRITSEGLYLAAEDTVDAKHYAEHALGNVRDFNFDLARLHTHAAQSSRLSVLMKEYFEHVLPRLQACYSAHVVTEQISDERLSSVPDQVEAVQHSITL